MVDFKRLRAGKGKPNPVPPRETFIAQAGWQRRPRPYVLP
jgi:hypothetical protein